MNVNAGLESNSIDIKALWTTTQKAFQSAQRRRPDADLERNGPLLTVLATFPEGTTAPKLQYGTSRNRNLTPALQAKLPLVVEPLRKQTDAVGTLASAAAAMHSAFYKAGDLHVALEYMPPERSLGNRAYLTIEVTDHQNTIISTSCGDYDFKRHFSTGAWYANLDRPRKATPWDAALSRGAVRPHTLSGEPIFLERGVVFFAEFFERFGFLSGFSCEGHPDDFHFQIGGENRQAIRAIEASNHFSHLADLEVQGKCPWTEGTRYALRLRTEPQTFAERDDTLRELADALEAVGRDLTPMPLPKKEALFA